MVEFAWNPICITEKPWVLLVGPFFIRLGPSGPVWTTSARAQIYHDVPYMSGLRYLHHLFFLHHINGRERKGIKEAHMAELKISLLECKFATLPPKRKRMVLTLWAHDLSFFFHFIQLEVTSCFYIPPILPSLFPNFKVNSSVDLIELEFNLLPFFSDLKVDNSNDLIEAS